MPTIVNGEPVYTDDELAQAREANAATAQVREKQARIDSLTAQAKAMDKLGSQAARFRDGVIGAADAARAEVERLRAEG